MALLQDSMVNKAHTEGEMVKCHDMSITPDRHIDCKDLRSSVAWKIAAQKDPSSSSSCVDTAFNAVLWHGGQTQTYTKR